MSCRRWVWWLVSYFWATVVSGAGPPSWDTANGATLSVSSKGIGTAYVVWPTAQNNVFSLTGYQLFMQISDRTQPQVKLFDGKGFPAVREYLAIDLTVGSTYDFSVIAWNEDPATSVEYSSVPLQRTFLVSFPVGLDPTVVSPPMGSYVFVAGSMTRLAFQGFQPDTGQLQTVGPICDPVVIVSCVVGRIFTVSFADECELDYTNAQCNWIMEGRGSSSWSPPLPMPIPIPFYVGFDPDNVGQYTVDIAPPIAGTYNAMIQALTPGQILALYWDNEKFDGYPTDINVDTNITHTWGSGAIIVWATEFVSVRWLGYISPITDGMYDIQCVTGDSCSVWIEGVQYLDSATAQTSCLTGCLVGNFYLKRSQYYRIRVDFITTSGDAYISLQWKNNEQIPSYVDIDTSNYWRGALVQQTPMLITVESNTDELSGQYSSLYSDFYDTNSNGEINASVGLPFVYYMRVADITNSTCTSPLVSAEILLSLESTTFPGTYSNYVGTYVRNCVYGFTVIVRLPGRYVLHGYVNGMPVSNSGERFVVAVSVNGGVSAVNSYPTPSGSPHTGVVSTPFAVYVNLVDMFDNPVASLATENLFNQVPITNVYLRPTTIDIAHTSTTCGTRSNFDWSITCFSGDFTFKYVDDALLIPNDSVDFPINFRTFPPEISQTMTVNGVTQLVVDGVAPPYAGPLGMFVQVGDDLLTNGPIPVSFGVPDNHPVNATMSLVQLLSPHVSLKLDVYVELTDITLLVLLRDSYGNILNSRGSETVLLVITGPSNLPTNFSCSYNTNTLYTCGGWITEPGPNAVTVTVNGDPASVTSGQPPQLPECQSVYQCGSTDRCPCEQARTPFSMNINAAPYPG